MPKNKAKPSPASSSQSTKQREEDVLVPEVSTLPPAVARLTWPEKLILADDFLKNPRRFLAQTTHSEAEAKLFETQPKADHKRIAYTELRQVLDAFIPDSKSILNNRRIQKFFLLQKLNELPADELETGVSRLINTVMPFGSGDRSDKDAWGEEEWTRRKKLHWEWTAEVINEIDAEIRNRLVNGERDQRLVVTSDLGSTPPLSLHSESDLYWTLEHPLRLSGILYDNLPEASPLRQLDPQRLPKINRVGGAAFVILGPSVPHTLFALPRAFYSLATVESFCRLGWQVWAERHKSILQYRDTPEEFHKYQKFEELCKKETPTLWKFPEAPPVPSLEGFANRSLFVIDLLNHFGKYISKPTTNRSLSELLTARRVLVSETAEQAQNTAHYSARAWVGGWYEANKREELAEALWGLAKTTLQAVEDLEIAYRDHALSEYQSQHILKAEVK